MILPSILLLHSMDRLRFIYSYPERKYQSLDRKKDRLQSIMCWFPTHISPPGEVMGVRGAPV